ncbi:hypothetical protein PRVXH_002081 [Proteinivorax hydrogeniformans]|uniref:hypothetical protein n=1 Tax=Proteinivorax hydrogeniformans TaxID=1826727 RepID=UPI00338E11B9
MDFIIILLNFVAFFIATVTFLYLAVNVTNAKIKIVDNRWTFAFFTFLILPSVIDGVLRLVQISWGDITAWAVIISFLFMVLITAASFHQKGLLILNADEKALLNWVSKNLSQHKPKLTSKKENSFLLKEISVILRFNVVFNIGFLVLRPSQEENKNKEAVLSTASELKEKLEGQQQMEKSPLFTIFMVLFFITLIISFLWALQIFAALN